MRKSCECKYAEWMCSVYRLCLSLSFWFLTLICSGVCVTAKLDYPVNKSLLRPTARNLFTCHDRTWRHPPPGFASFSFFPGWQSDFEHLSGLVGGLGLRLQRTAMQMMPAWAARLPEAAAAECVEGLASLLDLTAHLWTLAADAPPPPRRLCSDPVSRRDSEPESTLSRDLGGRGEERRGEKGRGGDAAPRPSLLIWTAGMRTWTVRSPRRNHRAGVCGSTAASVRFHIPACLRQR